jgi:DNA invertase Pin-like site-specific DNA recombinase
LPTSDTIRRIRLPGDLARSLEYIDDAELRKLQHAVNDEIERRSRKTVTKESVRPTDKAAVRIPEGKANLIRASFKAGLKPAAIARSLGVSLSLVRRVLQSNVSL